MSQAPAIQPFAASDQPQEEDKNASPSVFSTVPRALKRLEAIERDNPARLALFKAIYEGPGNPQPVH
jgi:hypothetical protein